MIKTQPITIDVTVVEQKYLALHQELATAKTETGQEVRLCLNMGDGSTFIKYEGEDITYIFRLEEMMIAVQKLRGVEPKEIDHD